jgi:hypothetical protein
MQGKHCVKVPSERSDLFIWGFRDGENPLITYEVREKETGKLLEPRRSSKFDITEKGVFFDGRDLPMSLAFYVMQCLNDQIN